MNWATTSSSNLIFEAQIEGISFVSLVWVIEWIETEIKPFLSS